MLKRERERGVFLGGDYIFLGSRYSPGAVAVHPVVRANFEAGKGPYSVQQKRVHALSLLARELVAKRHLPKGSRVKLIVQPKHYRMLRFDLEHPRVARRVLKENRARINSFHIMESLHFSIFWGLGFKYLMSRWYFKAFKAAVHTLRKAVYKQFHLSDFGPGVVGYELIGNLGLLLIKVDRKSVV